MLHCEGCAFARASPPGLFGDYIFLAPQDGARYRPGLTSLPVPRHEPDFAKPHEQTPAVRPSELGGVPLSKSKRVAI